MNLKEVKEKYNIPETTVRKWIAQQKIHPQNSFQKGKPYIIDERELLKIKTYYWDDKQHRSYEKGWNRNIFSTIDTPEKAYWLGFILADGCIHLTKPDSYWGHFSIDIGGRDAGHLKKFADFIEAKEDIIQYTKHSITGKDLVHVQLSSSSVLKDLVNLGITPRKSGKENWIDTPYPADFIRGCYDGDGYIKEDLHSIGLVGSYNLLQKIQEHFFQVLNIPPKKIGKHGVIYRIEYTSLSDRQKIVNYLWYDGCVSLDRKQVKADKIKKIC